MKALRKPMLAVLGTGAMICAATCASFCAAAPTPQGQEQSKGGEKSATHEISGTIRSMKGMRLTVETRTGSMVQVDAGPATEAHRCVALALDHAIDAIGTTDKAGVLHAETVQHAKPSPAMWSPDR
jgi:hypothetical protein